MIAAVLLAGVTAAATLAGTVRGPDGAPVAGVAVNVGSFSGSVSATTDANGRFEAVVEPGAFRVRAVPPEGSDLMPAWSPGVADRCGGARFEVEADDAVAGADIDLRLGVSVLGTLLDPVGDPLVGAVVTAVTDFTHVRTGTTGAGGRFAVRGVVPGSVVVAFVAEGLPVQYAGSVFSATEAVPVTLTGVDVLDLGPMTMRPGVTLGGLVFADGAPAAEGTVRAYSGSTLQQVPVGADGRWVATGLPPGVATAWGTVDGFATTYHPDADRPDRFVTVSDGEEIDDLDLWLPPEAALTGTLSSTFGVTDWTGAIVSVVNDDHTVGVVAEAAPDGTFRVGGLHGGRYTLHVTAAALGVADEPLRDDEGQPRVVDVPAEGTLSVGTVHTTPATSVHGTVTHAGSGAPVPAALVAATSEATGEIRFVYTSSTGAYALDGLAAGVYLLTVRVDRPCATDEGYVTLHYPNVPNPAFTVPFRMEAGATLQWDPALPPDDEHDGMDDRWERQNGLDPRIDDADEDPDRDGYTNLEEYLLGTDPHDPDRPPCGCGSGAPPVPVVAFGVGLLLRRRRFDG